MKPPSQPVAIVGAGVGGLALALALHRRRWPVVVYERAPRLEAIGAGLNLWQNATHVLRELGVLDALAPLGTRYARFDIVEPDGALLRRSQMPQARAEGDLPGMFVRRADLQRVLLDALPPGTVRTGHALASFEPAAGQGLMLHFEGGERAVASALVGADGVRSRVRRQLFGTAREVSPVYRGYGVWQGLVPFVPAGYTDGLLTETWGAGRRFSLFPAGVGETYWFAVLTQPEDARVAPGEVRAHLRHHFAGFHAPVGEVIDAIDEATVHATPIHDLPKLPSWHSPLACLIGDAAHAITPNVGQGACLALEDALVLARRLEAAETLNDAFNAFERARRRRVASIGAAARVSGWVGQWRAPALVRLRRRILRSIPDALVARQMAAWAGYRA